MLLIQTTYLPPMLRLKTVLNLKKMPKRMIHLRFEKKKHLISTRTTLEKTSSQEDMGRNENCGYRNPCPFHVDETKEEEHYNRFSEWMKPHFLQIPLTDAIKLPPYAKYLKDIVTNKRKVPNEAISTMLANYSFNGKIPEKLGD